MTIVITDTLSFKFVTKNMNRANSLFFVGLLLSVVGFGLEDDSVNCKTALQTLKNSISSLYEAYENVAKCNTLV